MFMRICRLKRKIRTYMLIICIFLIITLIKINHQINKTANENVDVGKNKNKARIMCLVLAEANELRTRAKIVYESWANECDKTFFVTKIKPGKLNESIESFVDNVPVLQVNGLADDNYAHLTDKVLLLLKDMYLRHNDFDWYLKADDNTFIFVDNLRKFLADKNSSEPITFGYDYKPLVIKGYHSGGAGYVLSREALHKIGPVLEHDEECTEKTGVEDVDIGRCLRLVDVYPGVSIDEKGRERFHPLNPYSHYYGIYPEWMYRYSTHQVKSGMEAISESTISFHYMAKADIKLCSLVWKEYQANRRKGIKQRFSSIVYTLLNIEPSWYENLVEFLFD